jgi:uncharacterized protein YqgV (UPF0045/DUF77 family)
VKLTAELSLYPFRADYIEVIQAFIDSAASEAGLDLVTNAMSTQISGDWDTVMNLISRELKTSYEKYSKQVLVCKLIPGELDIG